MVHDPSATTPGIALKRTGIDCHAGWFNDRCAPDASISLVELRFGNRLDIPYPPLSFASVRHSSNTQMIPVHEKAISIFREIAGERAEQLVVASPSARQAAGEALCVDSGRDTAANIAFHMCDWNSDAAFITAFLLFPERFTAEEIRSGIESFLIHAPNHLAAAAKLRGYPVQDTFEVGALEG